MDNETCKKCCHSDICAYIDFGELEEEACVGCCCGDLGECRRDSVYGVCSNYETEPILG
jgi:hypothetical protein